MFPASKANCRVKSPKMVASVLQSSAKSSKERKPNFRHAMATPDRQDRQVIAAHSMNERQRHSVCF